jgi:hypothetical protein
MLAAIVSTVLADSKENDEQTEIDHLRAAYHRLHTADWRTKPPPTPTGTGASDGMSNIYAKVLSACYLTLFVFAFIQLGRTIVHRHKIKSFRFGFLLVCWMWTWLRVVWFLFESAAWPRWLSGLIYFLPNACQIATFSLLILFYAKLVHRHRWRFLRLRFLGFCILSNTAMVFLTLTFSILMDRVQKTEDEDPTSQDAHDVKEFVYKMYFISSAVFFGVLVILAAIYIRKLRAAPGSTAGTSKQEVILTSLIFLIFLSRCIWDVLAAFDSDSTVFRHQISESTNSHWKLMNLATFLSLFIWEVAPTLMVIVYFRNIPSTSDSHCVGAWTCFNQSECVRSCLGNWPCGFPPEYFEAIDLGGSHPQSQSPGVGDERSPTSGEPEPSYTRMDEDVGTSSALPPGSFVRSSSHMHSAYGRSYSSNNGGPPQQMGMQIGSLSANKGPVGSLAGGVHLGIAGHHTNGDLYGSPTWLNPHHPALTQLHTPPVRQSSHGVSSNMQHSFVHSHQHHYDEDDFARGAHPAAVAWTQQHQQQQSQQLDANRPGVNGTHEQTVHSSRYATTNRRDEEE